MSHWHWHRITEVNFNLFNAFVNVIFALLYSKSTSHKCYTYLLLRELSSYVVKVLSLYKLFKAFSATE